MSYDSSLNDTKEHIAKVKGYLLLCADHLRVRADVHDASKLEEPELSGYAGLSDALQGLQYGTPEHRAAFMPFKEIIQHHYQYNSHHPEYYPNGVNDMSLLDIIEMFCDWKAASERHADGNFAKSLEISRIRFGISDQLASILENTPRSMGQAMNIVIANGPGKLDNGQEVILFPSRWDSGIPNGGKKPFEFFPYELAYLSALLKRELDNAKVTMLDGNIEGYDGDRYIQEIRKLDPDVLICELSALTYPTMTRVMQAVNPERSILCGPMGAINAGRIDVDHWDFSFAGEYELKVLHHLGGTVPAEAYTDAGLINLDWLPWPEDEDIDRSRYYEVNHYAKPAVIQVYPTRGCPLSCTFCVVPTYYGGHGKTSRSHRCRDVGDVCDEIEYLAWKHPAFHGCYFNEEAHNANVEWLTSFCEALIARGLNRYQYDAMCGYWTMTEDLVKLMGSAGYKQIRFGIESTSAQVGKSIGKTIHLEKMERFLGWCKAAGIKTYGTVQIGAPGSTEQTDRQTIEDVRRWYALGLMQKHQVSTSTPQPGTPFYDEAKRNGWLVTEDINLYDGVNAVVNYPDYSAAQIRRVRMAA